MRTSSSWVYGLPLILALAGPAVAQNDSVIVGGDGTGQTLIDPATGQTRFVPALLQPWQDDAIRLKPPGHHARKPAAPPTTTLASEPTVAAEPPPPKKKKHVAAVTPPPAEAPTTTQVPEPTVAAAPPPKKKVRTAAVTPPPAETPRPTKSVAPKSSINGFADIDLITGTGQHTQASPPPPKPATPKPTVTAPKPTPAKPAMTEPKPVKTASIEKPRAKTPTGSRKDSITFIAGASEPSGAAVSSVRSLAASLSGAMGDSARVQLMAYAGMKGEKTSDTRRLSLKRALVIRQLLIDDGVPSERIDVFALGGADDDGPLDRVDVFLKG